MMGRMTRTVALVLAALAPIACATESGPVQTGYGADLAAPDRQVLGGADLFDEAGEPASVAVPTAAASSPRTDAALPVDPASLQSQADEAYRARRFDEAVSRYDRLLALQPSNAHAWLRLGNVHHQRRDWFKALAAYRRAGARSLAGVETDASLRAKAIYNVALINLELARQSLRSLERLGDAAAAAGDPAPLAREIARAQRRLDRYSTNEIVSRPPATAATPAATPVPASTRVSTPASSKGSASASPERKTDELPKVDYIRGEPRP